MTTATPPVATPAAPSGQAGTARTVDYHVPGSENRWRVTVNGLYRESNLAVMKLSITCALETGKTCDAPTDFTGSQSVPPATFTQNFLARAGDLWTLGGFYLTDPTTGTDYIPVYRAAGEPLSAPVANNMAAGRVLPAVDLLPRATAATTAVTRVASRRHT